MKRLALAVALLVGSLISNWAHAEINIKSYREMRAKPEGATLLDMYVIGIVRGAVWESGYLEKTARAPIFCTPDNLRLDIKIIESLIAQELKEPLEGKPYADSDYIEMVIVYSLIHRFPCGTLDK